MAKKVLCAFDKFKETLECEELARLTEETLRGMFGRDRVAVSSVCLSDGGDGFLASLTAPLKLQHVEVVVSGPLGPTVPVKSKYGVNQDKGIAVIEMALASGIALVPPHLRNPSNTTTRGTGELILHAYQSGFRKILLGVGGSATNDAGIGCLQALGISVTLNDQTTPSSYITGGMLSAITSFSSPTGGLLPGAEIEISCDVTTPLFGPAGATAIFSKQKGAITQQHRDQLEAGVAHVASLFPFDSSSVVGSGAAGGLSGGLLGFFGQQRVTLTSGFDTISSAWELEPKITAADLVVTGEGSFDDTTLTGKLVMRVLQLCAKHHVLAVVLCGRQSPHSSLGSHLSSLVHIYDMASHFGLEKSMNQPTDSFIHLIKDTALAWPVLSLL